MLRLVREAADFLRGASRVDIYGHIDPDGIASGTIASLALERMGIEHRVHFLKKLDSTTVEEIKDNGPEAVWFTDLGSGLFHLLADMRGIVTDHHVPSKATIPKERRHDLLAYSTPRMVHVNPHLAGLDGTSEVSSAGCAYLVARELNDTNSDLACLGIVGAVGDMQDRAQSRLIGLNRRIMEDGVDAGVLQVIQDLRLFGRETRPVFKLLQYANDPPLPRLTEDEEACIVFFLELGIDLKADDGWRRWIDLASYERKRVVSELVTMLLQKGYGHKLARRLVGEVYLLAKEQEGTPLHDAKEFATLLNACGRYDAAEVGYQVCRGDRDAYYERALELLREHRSYIVNSLDVVQDVGLEALESIQFFHGGSRIRDTVVGIAAGMVLGSSKAQSGKPLIAFADCDEGVKVSARAPRNLLAKGLNLAEILHEAAALVGGEGGGHNIAAGATIPEGSEEEFLRIVDQMVREQLGG
ncbi:MAG: DHHA1 domain-containing protein [Thermoplasmata archaeon]